MTVHRATLDVPRKLAQFTAKLLHAETPRGSRALTCFWQAVLGLRWFRDRTAPDALARDHGISRATAYRYLDEAVDLWYSGTAHAHGGNIQAVMAPDGFPLWVSEVEPGSVQRHHRRPPARPARALPGRRGRAARPG